MSLELVIRCDGCDRAGDSSAVIKAHQMRFVLHKLGWRNAGKHDLCPDYYAKEKQGRKRSDHDTL